MIKPEKIIYLLSMYEYLLKDYSYAKPLDWKNTRSKDHFAGMGSSLPGTGWDIYPGR